MAEETATETAIEPARAAEMIESDEVELIDVRRPDEWEAGRIEGARPIEVNDLTSQAESISKEGSVIFYCRSGNRSAMAAAAFRQAGWDAYSLAGGLLAWVEHDLPLEPADGVVAGPQPGAA